MIAFTLSHSVTQHCSHWGRYPLPVLTSCPRVKVSDLVFMNNMDNINTEEFILEVEKYPALWDSSSDEYNIKNEEEGMECSYPALHCRL